MWISILLLGFAGLLLDLAGRYLMPRVIQPLPPGITPDTSAEYGLLALMSNLNAYAITPQPGLATSGTSVTLTPAQATNGALVLTSGASGAFTINLPATSAILSAIGPTIPTNGMYGEVLFIQNNGVGQTGTLTVGDANTTLSGTMTIATNTTRVFLIAVTSATTISITNVGSLTL